jgi:hypothetical protein
MKDIELLIHFHLFGAHSYARSGLPNTPYSVTMGMTFRNAYKDETAVHIAYEQVEPLLNPDLTPPERMV